MDKIIIPNAPSPPKKPWSSYSSTVTPYVNLTQEAINEYKIAMSRYDAEYNEYLAKRSDILKQVVSVLKELGVPTHYSERKKSRARYPQIIQISLVETIGKFIPYEGKSSLSVYGEEQQLKNEEKKKLDKLSELQVQNNRDEAVKWLLGKGKVYGTDFTADNALETANEVAFEEKKAQEIESIKKTGFIDFCGSDNCEGCLGWNGEDRRCDCGNRRVDWTRDWQFDYKDPQIYGEAY